MTPSVGRRQGVTEVPAGLGVLGLLVVEVLDLGRRTRRARLGHNTRLTTAQTPDRFPRQRQGVPGEGQMGNPGARLPGRGAARIRRDAPGQEGGVRPCRTRAMSSCFS
jgi:hypothetical protein